LIFCSFNLIILGISSDLDERQRYGKIFEAADVDRNGTISYEEFKAFIFKVTTK
jgi:Ca2+-binding EF-hand superfamily protein